MKRLCILLLLATAATEAPAAADHAFGLGIELGAPTGLAMKYYLKKGFALEAGIGYLDSWNSYQGLHIHVDAVWHPAVLVRQDSFALAFTIGVGGRLFERHYIINNQVTDDDTHLGVRVTPGLDLDFSEVHIDVFLEIAFVFDFVFIGQDVNLAHEDRTFDLNPVLGVRYFF